MAQSQTRPSPGALAALRTERVSAANRLEHELAQAGVIRGDDRVYIEDDRILIRVDITAARKLTAIAEAEWDRVNG